MSEGWISVFERMPEEHCANSEMCVKESGLVLAAAFRVSGEGGLRKLLWWHSPETASGGLKANADGASVSSPGCHCRSASYIQGGLGR